MEPQEFVQPLSAIAQETLPVSPFSLPPVLINPADIKRLSPAALAYLGDAVYELHIRSHYLMPPQRLAAYHSQVVAQVRAESQAQQLRSLEPYLTPTEMDIVRRGRNAASNGPKRIAAKIYQHATSLETLIGYLYLTDPQRLAQLLALIDLNSDALG